ISTRDWSSDVCSSDLARVSTEHEEGARPTCRRWARAHGAAERKAIRMASQRRHKEQNSRETVTCDQWPDGDGGGSNLPGSPGTQIGRASCREREKNAG